MKQQRQCEALTVTHRFGGEAQKAGERCSNVGTVHACGRSLCWVHQQKFNDDKFMTYATPAKEAASP